MEIIDAQIHEPHPVVHLSVPLAVDARAVETDLPAVLERLAAAIASG